MPPKKKSIRDFFQPASKDSALSQSSAPSITVSTARQNPSHSLPKKFRQSPVTSSSSTNPSRGTTSEKTSFNASQSSILSGSTSKRVISNGEQVVLNSDSDSDSLPDLTWNLPSTDSIDVYVPKPIFKAHESDLRKPPEKKKDDRAFMEFLHNAQKDVQSERQIAEAKADLEKPVAEEPPSSRLDISEETFASLAHDSDDPEKAKKLLSAMQRTNAFHAESVFHFWRKHQAHCSPFPKDCLPNHQWASVFQEPPSRRQAILSGFAFQVFRIHSLPVDLGLWMIDQICNANDETLDDRYLELLEAHQSQFESLFDKSKISAMFHGLGADPRCLEYDEREIVPSLESEQDDRIPLPKSLSQVCRLLQTMARCLDLEASSLVIYILLLLCMDASVCADASTLTLVQHTIETIICNISDNRDLAASLSDTIPLILAKVKHPVLQRQMIESFPVKSPLTAYLQRHLALSFLLYPTAIKTTLEDSGIPVLLRRYLQKSPHYGINKKTNYTHLAARLYMLDVAIGPGPLDVPYQPLPSLPSSPVEEKRVVAPIRLTAGEKSFNEQVDVLAQQIEFISSSIVESGAITDLSRLQAKDFGEKLFHRLQNAVRIGGKQKQNIFGSSEVDYDAKVWRGFAKISAKRMADGELKDGEEVR
ncbi:unnamed protein product [Periconia digitata]|uniref:Uncharacterized protein n=1 Tax=Periconia digitata TaxID=1303443 RepID=A0A9W4U3J2_9PLEO|nr:unnamed protein product [Periconia digitata]